MLIFNKRSSSSSDKSHKYLESNPQSTMLRQDFIDFNNSFNGNSNEDSDQYMANGANTSMGTVSNGSGISTVEEISVEEPHDGYVYQITIKKDYNKSLQSEETKTAAAKSNNNIYGTYRPISNSFFSYVQQDNSNNSSLSSPTTSTNNSQPAAASSSQSKDGRIYTSVKLKELKYATLPKFIEHLTIEETGCLDVNLVHVFLVTYRTFTDTATAIRMIQRRYEQVLPASLEMTEDVRVEHLKSIRAILYMWLENYVEDFNEPPDYTNLKVIKKFATKHLANTEIMHIIQAKFSYFENLANSSQISNSNSLLSIKIQLTEPDGTNTTTTAATSNINQMQASFASTSQFSISPTNSTASYSSSASARPPHHNNGTNNSHRRSSSNVPPAHRSATTNNFPIIAEFNPSATASTTKSSPSPTLPHSKSQTNLTASTTSNTILSMIANSLTPRTNNLVSAANPSQLMEATFMQIDSQYLAEQLTYIDKCLFPKVCAHLCLGGVWSTRYRKNASELVDTANNRNSSTGANSPTTVSVNSNNSTPMLNDKFASIGAFIDQFNCVSFIVQATVLENTDLKASDRAKIIRKWIEVAMACRNYKNLSSLNAIVQGLNTQCVSRLSKTWSEIPSEIKIQFDMLTQMFSEDGNQKEFRSILKQDLKDYSEMFDVNNKVPTMGFTGMSNSLIKKKLSLEGSGQSTAGSHKYSDINSGINVTLGRKYTENMKKQNKSQFREPLGTIPFLGTFLKDLEYLNAQSPKNDKSMINVMQKRREYEIISQIKLLQHAAQLYNIKCNPEFKTWLQKQTVYSEEQNYNMSYAIEPRGDIDNGANRKNKTNNSLLSGSTDSILSTPQSDKKRFDHSRHSSYGGSNSEFPTVDSASIKNSTDGYFTIQKNSSNNNSPKMNVKVIIEFNNPNEVLKNNERVVANTVIYKKIYIKDSDRTKDVKKAILEKFFLDPETCDKYGLVQVFSQSNTKELPIGDNCNVYYAAKNVPNDMQFVLRRRKSLNGGSSSYSTSIPNANSDQSMNNSPPKQQPMANTYRSPVLNKANKLAKKIGRSKTQQIIAQPSHSGQFNRNFDDLPPHYPNNK